MVIALHFTTFQLVKDFYGNTLFSDTERNLFIQSAKSKKNQPRSLFPENCPSEAEEETKIFPVEQKMMEFVTTRPP